MSEDSSHTNPAEIGCPRCQSPLEKKNAPFYLHGELVGSFESLVCGICRFSALTSRGYQEALLEAQKFGLIGPAEDVTTQAKMVLETDVSLHSQFEFRRAVVRLSAIEPILVKPGQKVKSSASTKENELERPEYYAEYIQHAKAKYEIPAMAQN